MENTFTSYNCLQKVTIKFIHVFITCADDDQSTNIMHNIKSFAMWLKAIFPKGITTKLEGI